MGFLESKYHVTSLRRQGLLEDNSPDQSVQFPWQGQTPFYRSSVSQTSCVGTVELPGEKTVGKTNDLKRYKVSLSSFECVVTATERP